MNQYKSMCIRLKQQLTFDFLFMVFILITGCTIGGMSSVNRTIESPTDSFDTAFANAVRAMNDVGKVTNSGSQALSPENVRL